MAHQQQFTRRDFLKTAAAATAAPMYVPSTAFGANERIVTGHIGTGGQGRGDMFGFLGRGARVAAICDVDQAHLRRARNELDKAKQKQGGGTAQSKTDLYGDFRRVLDRRDIDAVVVVTPDHWHSIPTILACESRKDVYCEKPLSLTIDEGRKMVEAARRNDRIVQTGTQQRSSENFRFACELVLNGYLGDLQEIQIGIPQVKFRFFNLEGKPRFDTGERIADAPPPPGFDYDFWGWAVRVSTVQPQREPLQFSLLSELRQRTDDQLGRAQHRYCPVGDERRRQRTCVRDRRERRI